MKPDENRVRPDCAYCAKGRGNSACRRRAEQRGKPFCRRFEYDPLLREPKKILIPREHDDEEFKL